MSSTGGVESKLHVGIFTPAFSYSSSLSYSAVVKATLEELRLTEDECEFLKQDNDKIACVIKNNKFTLQYVEETYAHNKALLDHLERAAEGLVAFQTKLTEDAELIRDLKEQLSSNNIAWESKYKEEHNLRMILQGKLDQLKIVVNSDISDSPEPSRPKIPKLQLSVMNGKDSTDKMIPPLMLADLRNGVTSPRNSPTRDPHVDAPRFPTISSPRDRAQSPSPVPQTITNMNGKRSISSSNMNNLIMSADVVIPHGNGKHPAGGVYSNETSPRTTLSPRGAQASPSPRAASASPRAAHTAHAITSIVSVAGHAPHVREHFRRHSTNFGGVSEEGIVRRHSGSEMGGRASSPRSKSSSEIPPHYFDLTQPDVHSMMPVVHSFSYGSTDSFSKRKSVIVHIKSRSETQMDVPAETLSQNKKHGVRNKVERAPSLLNFKQLEDQKKGNAAILNRSSSISNFNIAKKGNPPESHKITKSSSFSCDTALSCRLCACAKFRVTNVEWMCACGHANIKHAVFLKASPAPSPTVSPRKVG